MASAWGTSWLASWGNSWGVIGAGAPDPIKVLPIGKPSYRTIDAKTLADAFNRGQPVMADYEWPNGRKFYQNED